MKISTKAATPDLFLDAKKVFGSEDMTNRCWCMWFITSVKDFHAAGAEGNCLKFQDVLASSDTPVGVLAYADGEPAGWCAVGPRERYVRAIKTPSYRGGDKKEKDVWLTPCIFIRKEFRGMGISKELLNAAIELARKNGAKALDAFPLAGEKRRSGKDLQVGFEPMFHSLGFKVIRHPSNNRVVMRLELS